MKRPVIIAAAAHAKRLVLTTPIIDVRAVVRNDENIDWQARLFGAMQQLRAPFALAFVTSDRRTRSERTTLPLRRG